MNDSNLRGRIHQLENELEDSRRKYDELSKKFNSRDKNFSELNKYSLLIENTQDLISLHAKEGHYTFISPSVSALLGYQPEDLLGTPLATLVHPDDQEVIAKLLRKPLKKEMRKKDLVYRLRKQDHTYIWCQTNISWIQNEEGELYAFLASSRDITEQKQIEQKLRLSQRNYRKLAANIPLTDIYVFDKDIRFLIADGSSMHLQGMEPEDFEGNLLEEVFVPDIAQQLKPLYEATLKGERINADREINSEYYNLQSVPLLDENGVIEGGLFMSTNITEHKKAKDALVKVKEDLEKAQNLANIGNWEYDIVARKFKLSPMLVQFLHLDDSHTHLDLNKLLMLFKPVSRQKLRVAIHEAKETGRGFDMELQLARKPKTWIRAIAKDYDRADLIYKITGIFQNITETKESELRLIHYQQGLKTLNNIGSNVKLSFQEQLDKALGAVAKYMKLPLGLISHIQHEQYRICNYYSEDASFQIDQEASFDLEKTFYSLAYHKGEAIAIPSVKQSKYKAYSCYRNFRPEAFISAPVMVEGKCFGTVSFASVHPKETAFTEEDTEFIGVFARWVGATIEREKYEQELILAKKQAEEASQAKAQFLSTMSHEIRTPMNAVLGITHILLQDNPRPDQAQSLQILRFSGENLLALINDILDFSKIEAGKIEFEEADFDVRELVNGISQSLRLRAEEKGVSLHVNLDNSIPKIVIGDSTRLSQILTNLVGNAIKFTEKGRVDITLNVENITSDSISLYFAVKDTGIGIPEDRLQEIFDSFSQASAETTRKYGGTGLGLAITKRLLELQNSKINVKSTLSEGSDFYFSLKFKIFKNASDHNEKVKTLFHSKVSFESLAGHKVLLVEDNAVNVIIAQKFLSKWELDVDHVENGKEAISKFKTTHYDLILMDLQMPVMDGYEASKAIRSLDKEIPIIALTASVMQEIQDKVENIGMNAFVSKPLNPNELYLQISKYLKNNTLRPEL